MTARVALRGSSAPSGSHSTVTWLWIGGLAFGLRLLTAAATGAFHRPELFEYEAIARSLLAGEGFVYHAYGVPYASYLAPLYPMACAGLYALTGGSVAAVVLFQIALSAAHASLIATIADRLFKHPAGVMSGLLMACHPGLIIYSSTKLHTLTLDAFCFTLVLWQFLRLGWARTIRRSVWAGLSLGLSLLSRATSAVFWPVGAIWLVATAPPRRRMMALRLAALVAVCAAVVIAPWLVRSALLQRQFVFIQSTNWELFWRGNNPRATGHSYIAPGQTVFDALPPEALAELTRLPTEDQQARWFREQALAFIRAHPWTFAWLTAKKFYHFWWFAPQTGLLYPPLWLWGYQAFYLVVLGLAVAGGCRLIGQGTIEQRHAAILIGAFLLILSLAQSFHYVEGRHRWGVEPLLLILSGAGWRAGRDLLIARAVSKEVAA